MVYHDVANRVRVKHGLLSSFTLGRPESRQRLMSVLALHLSYFSVGTLVIFYRFTDLLLKK